MSIKKRSIELISWNKARKAIASVSPTLCNLIDQISPSKEYKLIKARYLYGDLIVNNGTTFLPSISGELAPITSDHVTKQFKDDLSYSHIPLFITLKNGNEAFLDNNSRIIPLNFFHPGNLLGVFETIDTMFARRSNSRWSVSAGSRSIFMLPKISEKTAFQRLRKHYSFASTIFPKHITDHWKVFKEMAQHQNFNQDWHNEVLFFPKNWIQDHKGKIKWEAFKNYLFEQAWEQAQFSIDRTEQNSLLESLSEATALRGLKPTTYITDQVKHILHLASGKSPGFRPTTKDNIAAPITGIQDSITNIYQLKNYLPTIMHAWPLNTLDKSLPIYYSLNLPTLLEGSPVKKSSNTIMLDLRDIKQLLDTLRDFARKHRLPNETIINMTDLNYFHIEKDMYHEIQLSEHIPDEDPAFLTDLKLFANHEFCASSLFWRGCLSIRKKPTDVN